MVCGGIDWASQSHQVCLVDADGECFGERAVAHGGLGIEELCDWLIARIGATPEVGVAIEMTQGPVVATTAVSARWVAIRSAVPPSVHPSDENPTTVNATAPATAPHTAGFTPGWIFISSPWLWEKLTSPVSPEESYRAASRQVLASETTQTTLARLDCRISVTVLASRWRGAAHANGPDRRIALMARPTVLPCRQENHIVAASA
jgi:transposase